MQKVILIALCSFVSVAATAQFTYKIKADSLKVTNDSCSAEFILENSTKNINGFLYNKGNGRTEFRKGLVKLNDSVYVIGGDTLHTGGGGGLWTSTGSGNIYNTDTSGKVGIGTSSPQENLDVKGDVNVSDTLRGRIVQIGTRLVSVTDGYTDFLIKNKTSGFTEAQMYYHPIYGVWNLATYRDYGGHQFRINSRIPLNLDTNGAAAQYSLRVGKVWYATPSAILDVESTDRGALLPRMTSSQRTGIASPATGLIAYDTDSSRYMIRDSIGWKGLVYTNETVSSQWTRSGSDISYNTGNVSTTNDMISNRVFSPNIIGGTTSTSGLTLQTTSGGSGSQTFRILAGNNGDKNILNFAWNPSGANFFAISFQGNRGVFSVNSETAAGYSGYQIRRTSTQRANILLLDDVGSLTGSNDSSPRDLMITNGIGNIRLGGNTEGNGIYTALHIDGPSRSVAIGTSSTPHASAQFEVVATSNNKATLLTRHTTTQKTAISSPANGLETFDTDLQAKSIYTNEWEQVATTSSAKTGTATLSSGTITINTAAVKAGSIIMVVHNTISGTQGILSCPAGSITAGTSFVINSSSNSDNSTVNWWIIN